jgi:hypothetical protein
MTKKQILKLRPEFNFYGMRMVEWFEITEGVDMFTIRSGLRHADGETKSPFYYEQTFSGKGRKKQALEHFNSWWNSLKN